MEYRNLGRSGLKVSVLSYGNMTSGMGMFKGIKDEYDVSVERHHLDLMTEYIHLGINFFDTAEIYGGSLSEVYLGNNLKQGGWDRDDLILTTKIAPDADAAGIQGNSRKRLRTAMQASLKRMQLDNVDIVYLHRPDADVPLKEQCSIMNELIENESAYYWGTSEFKPEYLSEIHSICEKHGWTAPIVEQCEYNMLTRNRFEVEFTGVFEEYGTGAHTPGRRCTEACFLASTMTGAYPQIPALEAMGGDLKKVWSSCRVLENSHRRLGARRHNLHWPGYFGIKMSLRYCLEPRGCSRYR